MKITGFSLTPLRFAFKGGGYVTSYGRRTHLNSVLLTLSTDTGMTGLGEICRLTGASPEPTEPEVSAVHARLLNSLLGADICNLAALMRPFQNGEPNHANLRCAVECASLDVTAKRADLPLWSLLGGRFQESVPEYATLGQAAPEIMKRSAQKAQSEGCRVFQLKAGGFGDHDGDLARIGAVLDVLHPDALLLVDANGAWSTADAREMIGQVKDGRVMWEEPCRTYEENRKTAEATAAPVMLDQCLAGKGMAVRACVEGVAAGIGIKPTLQGGLSQARLLRDLAVENGLVMKVDDSWCGDVGTAQALHLAVGVPPDQLICGIDMRPYFDKRLCAEGPVSSRFRLTPAESPGLGVTADEVDTAGSA